MPQGRGVCAHSAGQWGESAAGRGVCVCARWGVEDRTQESAYLKASEMLPQARLSHHFPQDPETGIVPVLLWRSLVGYSPWVPKELDMTERLHFYFD